MDENETIRRIARRAQALFAKHGIKRSRLEFRMEITYAHEDCGLRLEELLGAPDFDFIHDVGGIARHLDHETLKLGGCFLPRFAVRS